MLLDEVLSLICQSTVHTHSMETHSMEKVPSMEKFSINQTEYYIKHEVFGKNFLEKYGKSP